MEDIEAGILDIVAKKANCERSMLERATEISQLNLVSIDMMEIVFEIEEKFDISLVYNANDTSSAESGGFKTVGDVIDFVTRQMPQGGTPKVN